MKEQISTEPSPEELDAVIERLLEELYEKYNNFIELDDELSDEWYFVETEVKVGKDRMAVKIKLEAFLKKLEVLKEKSEK